MSDRPALSNDPPRQEVASTAAHRFTTHGSETLMDVVAVEEPLELRLHGEDAPLTLAVLMRTPGHDRELLLGWLVSLQYALFVMEESVEHRVTKAGYPAGTARATRAEATADERAEAARRYAERYRGATPP